MVRVRWATRDDAAAIAALALGSPDASFEHLYEYQEIRAADLGSDEPWYAVAEDGRRLVGMLPAVRTEASFLDGVFEFARSALVARDTDVARALAVTMLDRARTERLDAALLTLPDRAVRRSFPAHLDVDHCTQRAVLPKTAEELEARLGSKRRNHVKQAVRRGLVVRSSDPGDLGAWWEIYAGVTTRVSERADSRGLRLTAPESYAAILTAIRPHCPVRLVGIFDGEELVGGYLVLFAGTTAYLYRGGVRTDRLAHGTGDLLLLEVFREVLAAGCTEIDLGETGPSGDGLYAFKAAYGGRHRDNSQILCDLSGSSAILHDDTWRRLAPSPEGRPAAELASFLLGPPMALPDEPVSPGREWLAVDPAALPTLRLPPLAGSGVPALRAAIVGAHVGAADLEDLVQRTWASPAPLACAVAGDARVGWRFVSALSLLRRGPPERFAPLRPAELAAARVPSAEGELVLVVSSRKDVEDLFALAAHPDADGLRLPADPFGRTPVRILDACRLLPTGCPARHLETLHVDEQGLRPCRPGPRVGVPGDDVTAVVARVDARSAAYAARRDCASCPVAPTCARCLADDPIPGADYCATRRAFPRLGDLALLVEAAGRYVGRALRPAARESFEWRAAVPPEDDRPPPEGAWFPPVPADVIGLYVDGRALACSVRTGNFAEIGDTLAQILEAARGAEGPRRVAALLRGAWDADDDDVVQACTAVRELLVRLASSRS